MVGQVLGSTSGTLVLRHAVAWSVVEGTRPEEPEEEGVNWDRSVQVVGEAKVIVPGGHEERG